MITGTRSHDFYTGVIIRHVLPERRTPAPADAGCSDLAFVGVRFCKDANEDQEFELCGGKMDHHGVCTACDR